MSNTYNPYQQQIEQLQAKIEENQALANDPELGELAQAEVKNLQDQLETLKKMAEDFESNLTSENEASSDLTKSKAIIEIRGGAGGDEAKIWADDLLRMYMRYCDAKKLKYEMLDDAVIKISGRTEIDLPAKESEEGEVVETEGAVTLYPYEIFKYESGVHRVQRIPSTESQGRIHTSTASVAVLPEVPTNAVEIKDEDLDWQFMRASGAGGQSVNKTSSAVRLTHKPSGIVIVSRKERKQAQNRQIALELLRSQLWEIEEEKKQKELGEARSVIGRAMRAEKIRTYNYPQNRVTDHRINKSWYALDKIVDGGLDEVIGKVRIEMEETEESDQE